MTYLRRIAYIALLAAPLAGCSESGGGADAGLVDCEGEQNGTACAESSICVDGLCVGSSCGDGIVDSAAGEQCDDENMISGDGCEPSDCTYSCEIDADCNDADPCNGVESCATSLHRCQAGTPPADGTVACDYEATGDGLCRGGLCASADCGNGVVDPGEECDEDSLGCESDCTWQCDEAADCDDGNACNGSESCNIGTHTCNAPGDTSCDDGDPCSIDFCDPESGCEHTQDGGIDNDGWAPAECSQGSTFNGGDCDDEDPSVNPGEDELCDAISHDCDEQTDEGTEEKEWYPDVDGDGWPDQVPPGERLNNCMDPNDADPGLTTDYMLPRQNSQGEITFDCADNVNLAHPDDNTFRTHFYCLNESTGTNSNREWISSGYYGFWGCPVGLDPTYDWNCDGTEYRQYRYAGTLSCGGGYYCSGATWDDGSVPDCGYRENLTRCESNYVCCVVALDKAPSCSAGDPELTTQGCR